MHYATLYQVKSYLDLDDDEDKDDVRLSDLITRSVGAIDAYKGRRFDVRYEVRHYDVPKPAPDVYGSTDGVAAPLRLKDDLLEIVSLTNGDDVAIAAANYTLEPADFYPKNRIWLFDESWTTNSSGNSKQVIDVAGYWGYHSLYGSAWGDSLDTVENNPLSSSGTSITVNDANGVAGDGSNQRFQAGQMIKIDSEFMYVTAVNNIANTLTVQRAYNGTTAAAHTQDKKIYIYRPMENIVFATIRMVAWRYRQKDADTFDRTAILGTGVQIIPSAMPADVKALLGSPKASL